MSELPSREVRLVARPVGAPTSADFELASAPAPAPQAGEIQVRNHWMSVDPYMRGRMADRKSYVPPFALGAPMQGGAVGVVERSEANGFRPGDWVLSMNGWREAWTGPADGVRKLPVSDALPAQAFLGVAGMTGLTAYVGVKTIAELKAGETMFVSAAAGAVGSMACQIGKIIGARVIGAAGGSEKLAFLETLGVDEIINYREHAGPDGLTRALEDAAPNGVDVYFDNVGGDHLAAALNVLNNFGRVAVCGMISQYNAETPQPGPSNLTAIIGKRLRVQGFIVSDHVGVTETYFAELTSWIEQGKIVWRETIREGIESAAPAFLDLFTGANVGKMLVRLS